MKKWSREKKRGVAIIVLMLGVVGLLTGLLIDMLAKARETKEPESLGREEALESPELPLPEETLETELMEEKKEGTKSLSVARSGDESLYPAARILCSFLSCGHSLQMEAPKGLLGLTEQEMESLGYRVERIPGLGPSIRCSLKSYCPKHLLLCYRDGRLFVEQLDPETLRMKESLQIPLETQILEPLLLAELENGVEIQSLDEVEEYLEALES